MPRPFPIPSTYNAGFFLGTYLTSNEDGGFGICGCRSAHVVGATPSSRSQVSHAKLSHALDNSQFSVILVACSTARGPPQERVLVLLVGNMPSIQLYLRSSITRVRQANSVA